MRQDVPVVQEAPVVQYRKAVAKVPNPKNAQIEPHGEAIFQYIDGGLLSNSDL